MDLIAFDSSYKEKSKYKFWTRKKVRFNDLDMLGHVNSVRVGEYYASLRTLLFNKAVPQWPRCKLVPVLKTSVMTYEREIRFPSDLDVGLIIEKFGNTSLIIAMGLFVGSECAGLCRNLFVFIDTETRKPAVPDEKVRQGFMDIAGNA